MRGDGTGVYVICDNTEGKINIQHFYVIPPNATNTKFPETSTLTHYQGCKIIKKVSKSEDQETILTEYEYN